MLVSCPVQPTCSNVPESRVGIEKERDKRQKMDLGGLTVNTEKRPEFINHSPYVPQAKDECKRLPYQWYKGQTVIIISLICSTSNKQTLVKHSVIWPWQAITLCPWVERKMESLWAPALPRYASRELIASSCKKMLLWPSLWVALTCGYKQGYFKGKLTTTYKISP